MTDAFTILFWMMPCLIAQAALQEPSLMPNSIPEPTNTTYTVAFYANVVDNLGRTSAPSSIVTVTGTNEWIQLAWMLADTNVVNVNVIARYADAFTTNTQTRTLPPVNSTFWPFVWSNWSITVSVPTTGDVFAAHDVGGPWFQIKTQFHGRIGSWTNSTPSDRQFYHSTNGVLINRTYFN